MLKLFARLHLLWNVFLILQQGRLLWDIFKTPQLNPKHLPPNNNNHNHKSIQTINPQQERNER